MNMIDRLAKGLVLLGLLLGASGLFGSPAQAAQSTLVPAAPMGLVNTPFSHWTVGGFFLYWSRCDDQPGLAAASPAADDGYLRRLPTGFGRTTNMNVTSFCADHFAADESGLYAATPNQDIVKRLIGAPYTSVLVHHTTDVPIMPLTLVGNQIYWISSTHIYRVNKDGSGAVTIANDTHGMPTSNLVVLDNSVVWLANGGLWWADLDCGSLPCGETFVRAAQGGALVRYGQDVIWRDTTTVPQTIQRLHNVEVCLPPAGAGCGQTTVHSGANSANARIGTLAVGGSNVYFVENECADPIFCTPSTAGRLRRISVGGGTPETIAQDVPNFGDEIHAHGCCIYFELSPPTARQRIVRLRLDATPLIHDLEANAWEVTQAIQRLTNNVPLVANKPTYVRVYGLQLAGPRANTVEAVVYGWRYGVPLPGSPLWPMEGRARSLVTGASYNRLANDGWLFQLPDAWTNAGPITLQVRLDPRAVYDDPNLSNNVLPNAIYPAGTFNFIAKSPVCIVAVPVRTHGPVASSTGANYWAAIGMVRRVFPTPQVWTYQQASDIAEREFNPIPVFGPYEIPEDSNGILQSLWLRSQFSDDPDECDNANARTHYIGIVSPQTPTGNANVDLGTDGTGFVGFAQAWVKLPPDNVDPTMLTAMRLSTLAHEVGHNYDRKHVNCGDPDPDSLDLYYPYPVCELDYSGLVIHVGFDSLTLAPIQASATGDLMSYAHNEGKPLWISDYTWRGLLQDMPHPGAAQSVTAIGPTLAGATQAYFVAGTVSPSLNQGSLEPVWVYPVASLSDGILAKWQALTAPSANSLQSPSGHSYHVRLLDAASGVLADQAVTSMETGDGPGATAIFVLTFPAPGGTAVRVELLDGTTVLASWQPGPNAPVLTLTQPVGGQVVQDALTVAWQATDADVSDGLYYTIQYSPDGGLTWRALVNNHPHTSASSTMSLTLNLAGLPGGTTSAVIRVAASDGLHTTLATSAPFQVANRPPQAAIFSPALGQAVPAGQPVVLQGGATDPEDGGLPDAS